MRGNSNSSNSVASTTISKIICALGKLWFLFQISSTMKPEMLVTIREYNPADPDPISKAWDATQNKVRIFWPFKDNMQEIPYAFYSSVFGEGYVSKNDLSNQIYQNLSTLSRYVISTQEKSLCMKN